MADHDNGYKHLFSHPQMVEDLLLEFQSRTDPFMAVRVLTYVGLLYQELVRQGQLTPSGKLPPVLPLVLYNGRHRWSAATELAELVDRLPGQGLARYCPHMRYLLLDEGALRESDLPVVRNLAAALFRLERGNTPEDLQAVVGALKDWLRAPEQDGLRRAFTVWINRVLLPARFPGADIPEIADLQEVETMLSERVIEWTKEWKQQGLEQGLEQGRQEGRLEGEVALLERQLTRRFGPLDDATRARLAAASTDQLEEWALRVLDAASLDDVFAQ